MAVIHTSTTRRPYADTYSAYIADTQEDVDSFVENAGEWGKRKHFYESGVETVHRMKDGKYMIIVRTPNLD